MRKSSSGDQKHLLKKRRISSMTTTFKQSQSMCLNCMFCKKLRESQANSFSQMINKALYSKYSSSQNYYYSKDICDILDNESTRPVVFFRDLQVFIEDDDYLKRLYKPTEVLNKFDSLIEYYRYHIDIPRLYMKKICRTIYYYHDKKRRLEYVKIKQNLGLLDEDKHESIKEPINVQLINVLGPLQNEYSLFQQPQSSKQLLKKPITKQKLDPSISIISIIQNIPKFDNLKAVLYLDSFDESYLGRQLQDISKIFKQKKVVQKTKIMKPKLKQNLINSIPQTVIQSLINMQRKQIQSLKKSPSQTIKPLIQSIDIDWLQKRNIKSPQQSQKSTMQSARRSVGQTDRQSDKKLFENRVYFPLRKSQSKEKSRRTNSNYQPQINSSNLVLNQQDLIKNKLKINMTQLLQLQSSKLELGAATTRDPLNTREMKQRIQTPYQSQNTNRILQSPQIQLQSKHQRTRSTDQLIQHAEISANDVYVSGVHKKTPSLITFKQTNQVSAFMDEIRNNLKVSNTIRIHASGSTTGRSMLKQRSSIIAPVVRSGILDFSKKNSKN